LAPDFGTFQKRQSPCMLGSETISAIQLSRFDQIN
jgi:hypothetical protein